MFISYHLSGTCVNLLGKHMKGTKQQPQQNEKKLHLFPSFQNGEVLQ